MMNTIQTPSYLRRLMVVPACLLFTAAPLLAQQAAQPAPNEEIVKMSPFEVQASSHDVGYYAENTLAGSRMNTNVGDLASSITIVTKQQMIDTGAVDLNDVFLYEANTEGARTYTPSPQIAGTNRVVDAIAGWSADQGQSGYGPSSANRVRGLDTTDVAINNYQASARISFDSYNTNSVEINRGPNSLLFGTGSPAGITNQSTTQAILNKRSTQVQYQLSSWGGYRGSIGTNQPLGDKLAVFAAALYDSRGFQRKPSADVYRRQYVAITFQPFSSTRITANFENYDNYNRRPNSLMPRDAITPWLQAGRPAYNSVTQMLTVMDTGQVVGPYVANSADPRYAAVVVPTYHLPSSLANQNAMSTLTSPMYVPGIAINGPLTHRYMLINQGTLLSMWNRGPGDFSQPQWPTGIPATASRTQADWNLLATVPSISTLVLQPLLANGTAVYASGAWSPPEINDKSLYDWDSINTLSMNYGFVKAKTYNIELQQTITPELNLEVGWFRQEIEETDNYSMGQTNQQTALYVDPNLVRQDGTPNPYFGSPMEYDYSADVFRIPEISNTFRAQLAYEHDFSKNSGWTRWLGHHRLFGLWSRWEDRIKNLRYRLSTDGGDSRYLPNTNNSGWAYWNNGTFDRWYYLGQNDRGVVQYSPGVFNMPGSGGIGSANIMVPNYLTHSWDSASISFEPNYSFAGTTPLAEKVLESQNLGYQGWFWKDRIIATLGWRRDDFKARTTDLNGTTGAQQYPNGVADETLLYRMTPWGYLRGRTKTAGVVAYPFKKWDSIDRAAEQGNVFAEILRGLGGHINRSDNFNPPTGIQYDYFGTRLGKPQGTGKDYGLDLTLFNNKLYARINWFQSDNRNAPALGAATTAAARMSRMDTTSMRGWAEWVVRYQNGEDTTAYFGNNTVHPLTATEITQIEALMQDPNYSYQNNGWPAGWRNSNQTNKSKGLEGTLIYNPLPNWNMKLTVGKQYSTYSNIAPQLLAFRTYRLNIWENATATGVPSGEFEVQTAAASGTATPTRLDNFWTGYGFSADARLSNASGGTPDWISPQGFYNSAVAADFNVLAATEGQYVLNERHWTANFISTYSFTRGYLKGLKAGGAIRWADKAVAGYYGDTEHLNSSGQVAAPDLNRPIYTPDETHLDLWVAYTTKVPHILGQDVQVTFQINVRDVTESGGLLPVSFNYDGKPWAYRIKDPRQFLFTTTFEF